MLNLPKIYPPEKSPSKDQFTRARLEALCERDTSINYLRAKYDITENKLQAYDKSIRKLNNSSERMLAWAETLRIIGGFLTAKLCETAIICLFTLGTFYDYDNLGDWLLSCTIIAIFWPLLLLCSFLPITIIGWTFISSLLVGLYRWFPTLPFHRIFERATKRITKQHEQKYRAEQEYTEQAKRANQEYSSALRNLDKMEEIERQKNTKLYNDLRYKLHRLFGRDFDFNKYEKAVQDCKGDYIMWDCSEAQRKWLQSYSEYLGEISRKRESRYWYDLDPREFEIQVARHFEQKGYHTQITPQSNDGGKDIILKRNGEIIFVECKHYKKDKIDINIARAFKGVMADANVEKGILVTLNGVHSNCQSFCDRNNICVTTAMDLTKGYSKVREVDWDTLKRTYAKGVYDYGGVQLTGIQFIEESEASDFARKYFIGYAAIAQESQGSDYIYELIRVMNEDSLKEVTQIATLTSAIKLTPTLSGLPNYEETPKIG